MSDSRSSAIVVGAGLMGRWHAHAIRQCGASVVAVVDADAAFARKFAMRHGNVPSYASLTDALSEHSPTFVHVCTPVATHAMFAREALANGRHAIVEKPVAPSAADTRSLLELALEKSRWLVPVHQFPFQHGVRTLRTQLDELGDILHIEVSLASAGAQYEGADANAIVADIVTHCLSLAQSLVGASLPLTGWHVHAPREGEWRVNGEANATSLAFYLSMSTRPTFAEMRVFGTRASAFVDLFHGYSVIDSGGVSRAAKAARPFRSAVKSLGAASSNLARRSLHAEPAYPGLNELVRQTYLAAERGDACPVSHSDVLNVAEIRDVLIALAARHS